MAHNDEFPTPPLWRVLLGLILAPAVPAALVALFGVATGGELTNTLGFAVFLGGFYGVVPALVFGAPAYWVLRGLIRPTAWASVLAGAVVASVPAAAAALAFGAYIIPVAAPLGAIGGLTFWFVALRGVHPARARGGGSASEHDRHGCS